MSEGKYGFHIHKYGDCSASDAKSDGSHSNPFDITHWAHDDREKHAADSENPVADSNGVAHYERTDILISFR